jgi:hypothetical protein
MTTIVIAHPSHMWVRSLQKSEDEPRSDGLCTICYRPPKHRISSSLPNLSREVNLRASKIKIEAALRLRFAVRTSAQGDSLARSFGLDLAYATGFDFVDEAADVISVR